MCKNSFGPCAFDFGPKTPVTTNWPFGHNDLNKPKNGMDIPSEIPNGYLP